MVIPHPRELVLVDLARKEIQASVVVVGAGAKRFARALHESSGGTTGGPERPGEIEHFVVRLGDIRGYATRFFFYALGDSLDDIVSAADLVPSSTATILVQGERDRLEPALFAMAKKAREGRAILAYVGPKPAADELARQGSITPEIVSHDPDGRRVLSEIAKRVLTSLRSQ